MIFSMSGYAEKCFHSKNLSAEISIKSLNNRYFDMVYRGPQIGILENKLKAICQKKLNRGRVEVNFELEFLKESEWKVAVNENLLKDILMSVQKISPGLKVNTELTLGNIFNIPSAVDIKRRKLSDEENIFLEKSFKEVLDLLVKERRKEGKEIEKEIKKLILSMKRGLARIEKLIKKQPLLIKEKLRERMKELSRETPVSNEKMMEEIAFYAQKYDLTEEVVRLKSHLKLSSEVLSPEYTDPAGKKMDFIAQELYREANTINSKSQDMEIIKEILFIKGEIESLRQQVQNVE
ncbi:MAG: YicC/YloC family endoribonuclease [Candidatus Aminicenantaceae bacterium]